MFVIANTIKVKKGFADKLKARFDHMGKIENVPGFIELNLLKTRTTSDDYEEVIVWSKWESQKAHNEWTTSDMFKQAHKGVRTEYILDSNITFYDVISNRTAVGGEEKQKNVI